MSFKFKRFAIGARAVIPQASLTIGDTNDNFWLMVTFGVHFLSILQPPNAR